MLEGVGVVGTGSMARVLIPTLQAIGVKVVALWGPTEDQARDLARQFGIPFYTDRIDDVLLHQEVDLVCINTPPHLHAQVASKALGIGKHVLCERPAGINKSDAAKMVTAAQYYPSLMSIMNHGLRFLPAFTRLKRMVQDGEIGEVFLCDVRMTCGSLLKNKYTWMCDENMGGGVLNMIGSHLIDIITFLTGQKAIKVRGMVKTFVKQTDNIGGIRHVTSDDFSSIQMELSRGASASITLNTHVPGQFKQELLVIGSEGRLVIREADLFGLTTGMTREQLLMADIQHVTERQKQGIPTASNELPLPYFKGMLKLIDALKESFERRKERLNWDAEPVTLAATFEDAMYVQTVLDAVRESDKTGTWQPVVVVNEDERNTGRFFHS